MLGRLNRTFMELKLETDNVNQQRMSGLNRTFMELKHTKQKESAAALKPDAPNSES